MIFLYFALNPDIFFKYCDFLEKFILPFFFVPTRYKHILRVGPSPMPFLNFIFHFFTPKTSNFHVVYGAFIFRLPYIYFNMPFLLIRMAYPAFLKILTAFWMLEIHA